jgi:hypothetical protein
MKLRQEQGRAMFLLILSIVILFAGALVGPWLICLPAASDVGEGFLSVFVGGVLLLHVLPHCIEEAGWLVLPFFL